jgi:hypothetical protein
MGSLNGKCETCGQPLDYVDLKASDDICESCWLEQGIFYDEESK